MRFWKEKNLMYMHVVPAIIVELILSHIVQVEI